MFLGGIDENINVKKSLERIVKVMDKPLVSVIMSTYREREDHLKMAVESVLHQTYVNIEYIIIIDDPNNLHLKDILQGYAKMDKRIKILKNEINSGPTVSRNRGAQVAKGEYIAIMDADDVCDTKRIEIELQYAMSHPEVGIIFCERNEIDEDSNLMNFTVRKFKDATIPQILKYGNILTNSTAFIKRGLFLKMGGYREINRAEDYDLWLRCCTSGLVFHVIDQPLLSYRIRRDSLSHADFAKSWVGAEYARYLYKQRLLDNEDTFCDDDFNKYLIDNHFNNKIRVDKFNLSYKQYLDAIKALKNKMIFKSIKLFTFAFISDYRIIYVFINNFNLQKKLKAAMRK